MKDLTIHAVRPWQSVDAKEKTCHFGSIDSQDDIDKCLYDCPYRHGECVNCLRNGKQERTGRPPKCDLEKLKGMLARRLSAKEMCAELDISKSTLYAHKKRLEAED